MPRVKKSSVMIATLAVVASVSVMSPQSAMAGHRDAQEPNIVEQVAQKFGLNLDEVKNFFNTHRKERIEKRGEHRQAKMDDRLDKAVEAGKITADQKAKIIAKMEEQKEWRKSLVDMEPEARHEAIKKHHEELKAWAEENKIPLSEIMPHPPKGNRPMHKMMQDGQGQSPR